jgi:hypothetical protein
MRFKGCKIFDEQGYFHGNDIEWVTDRCRLVVID